MEQMEEEGVKHTQKSELGFIASPEQPLAPGAGKACASSRSSQRIEQEGIWGVWILLLSHQQRPKLFAIKQQVTPRQRPCWHIPTACQPPAALSPAAHASGTGQHLLLLANMPARPALLCAASQPFHPWLEQGKLQQLGWQRSDAHTAVPPRALQTELCFGLDAPVRRRQIAGRQLL